MNLLSPVDCGGLLGLDVDHGHECLLAIVIRILLVKQVWIPEIENLI